MAELMVMKATCKLRLFQVGSDMLVRHLLETHLDKKELLQVRARQPRILDCDSGSCDVAYLLLGPRPPPASRCCFFTLRDAISVAVYCV